MDLGEGSTFKQNFCWLVKQPALWVFLLLSGSFLVVNRPEKIIYAPDTGFAAFYRNFPGMNVEDYGTKLQLGGLTGVYYRKGNDDLAPWIALPGAGRSPQSAIAKCEVLFGELYEDKNKMPSIYSMDYSAPSAPCEAVIIEQGMALFQHVYNKHGKPMNVFGISTGCAVSIAVIERLGSDKLIHSLTLLDPFTTFYDAVPGNFPYVVRFLGIASKWLIQWKNTNLWRSEQRIVKPVFKRIPICIFSGTKDDKVPPEMHNQIYALAAGIKAPPVARSFPNGIQVSKNDLRMLIEAECRHVKHYEWAEKKIWSHTGAKSFFEKHVIKPATLATGPCVIPEARSDETLSRSSWLSHSFLTTCLIFVIPTIWGWYSTGPQRRMLIHAKNGEPGFRWWHTSTLIFLSVLAFGAAVCLCQASHETRRVRAHSLHEIVIQVPVF